MNRLRHPIRAIREPFGTAGLVVACIALIAALGGTAFAAKGALTGKQKKEVEKIAKKYAGQPGAQGPQGPAGPQGAAGANGKDGSNGAVGSVGPTGPTGAKGAAGPAGAVGEIGPTGATGATGSFGGEPLKAGATLTGTWATAGSVETVEDGGGNMVSVGSPFAYASISFPQKVHSVDPIFPHFESEPDFEDFCTGTNEEPTAPSRSLCVYSSFFGLKDMSLVGLGNPPGFSGVVDEVGTTLKFSVEGPEAVAIGAWAVTPN